MPQYPDFIIGSMRLGSWGKNLSKAELKSFVDRCLELGLNHFDHADIYGGYTTESWFGDLIKSSSNYQKAIQITTKCGIGYIADQHSEHYVKHYNLSKDHIIASAEQSLKNLGVEQIHSFLLHRPDYLLDPEAVALAFEHLLSSGKVKHIGLSNFSYEQSVLLHQLQPLDVLQLEISAMQPDLFSTAIPGFCQLENIALSSWSPLGGGSIFSPRPDEKCQRILKVLQALQGKYNSDIDNLLLAWLRTHPAQIIPITGTAKIERIEAYMTRGKFQLDRQDWYLVLQAARGEKVA